MLSPAQVDELFAISLLGQEESDDAWAAVNTLRRNGDAYIFQKAKDFLRSEDPKRRTRAANILGQMRQPTPTEKNADKLLRSKPIYVAESFGLIAPLLLWEQSNMALASEIYALGFLGLPAAAPLILPFATHANEDVRLSVACALGSFTEQSGVIPTLATLGDDPDDETRNWALFHLGVQTDADSPELRELFFSHIDDPYSDAREEAIAALCKRKDVRAVEPLLKLLDSGSHYMHHVDAFAALLEIPPDRDWGVDDWADAVRAKFHITRSPPSHPQNHLPKVPRPL